MDVVGHQAVAPHGYRRLAHLFREDVAIDVLISVLEEDRLAPVATRGHVVRASRNDYAGEASHPCGIAQNGTKGEYCSCPPIRGEEQLPTGCLVNLNARVYDPILGRFMSGDPVTGDIFDAQSLNRYGYVLNNPLSMTDTNGQCPICFGLLVGLLLDVAVVEVLKPYFERVPLLGDLFVIAEGIACPGPIGPVCAAEAAGSLAGVESGSVGKGLEAFVISIAEAGAFKFVGDELQASHLTGANFTAAAVISHGLVGGTFSVLQGGSFGSGFLAAGVSELATPYIVKSANGNRGLGTIESAIVGGTASVLGGGKFGNGAITGAFGYLYNGLEHMLAGQDAHNILLAYLQTGDDGGLWSGNTTFGGLFGSNRPDLVYDVDPLQVFEIKPDGSAASGAAQLAGYLYSGQGVGSVAGNFTDIFGIYPKLTLPSIWFFGRTTYTYSPSAFPGVVTYKVDQESVFDEIRNAFQQRSAGAPSPIPFPLPAPVSEMPW